MSTLNTWQLGFAAKYNDGEHNDVTDLNDVEDTYDEYFIFIMGQMEGVTSAEEARHSVQNAYAAIGEALVILGDLE